MRKDTEKNEMFQASHLMILISYTIFSAILITESLLLNWEKWALFLIVAGVAASWILHIRQTLSDNQRIWTYSILMMCTFFFYGSHTTSTYDLAVVMSAVITLYTMTGIKSLITLCQITYYITLGYELWLLISEDYEFDILTISRTLLHIAMIAMVGWIAKIIIGKWAQVLNKSHSEIEQLTDATDRLNDFLANVSHELRTPINAVIGLSGICIDKENDPEIRSDMTAVRSAGKRVAEQISDILDYSEIDRNKLTNNCEDYMIASVLNDLVTELRAYKPDELELIMDIDPSIPSVMNTDIGKLKKILHHLIMNGLKYTHEGGVYVRIASIPQSYGVNLCIEVNDTGIGMSEEELERISDRFYQVNSGRNRSSGGLGLGMAIVSGFVASLGGFMTIKSKPDAGTSVRVSIPQKVVDSTSCMSVAYKERLCIGGYLHFEKFPNPNVREYYNDMVKHIVSGLNVRMHRVDNAENLKKLLGSVHLTHLFVGEAEYLSEPGLMEKLAREMIVAVVADRKLVLPEGSRVHIMEKPFYCFPVASMLNITAAGEPAEEGMMRCDGVEALVVDDEPMNLTVARSILKRYGINVSTAGSGTEAVEMCREKRFDIVFMDHMMPGMDGVEAMKRIRSDPSRLRSDLPMIALTANAVSTAKEMFLAAGFDGFVSKPIELMELERVMKKVLPKSVVTYVTAASKPLPQAEAAAAPASGRAPEAARTENPAAEKAAPADSFLAGLKELGLDTDSGLHYCQNDREFYKTLLLQFASESKAKLASIEESYKNGDAADYEILVHALKSTAKMIGDTKLSESARELEFAAKEGRTGYISDNHAGVMERYRALTAGLLELLGGEAAPDDDDVLEFEPDGGDEIIEFEPCGE
ncbi:MAG: response regulator [Ruminiclostridium sp.]|nr:response regulator [Ruminiclostridium sp.]